METFAFLQVAVTYEDPHPAPELRSLANLHLNESAAAVAGVLAIGVATAVLSPADPAQALMRQGDRGAGVRDLQEQLGIVADGIYGTNTAQSVRQFQQQTGLQADGIAGPATLSALGLPANLTATGSTGGTGSTDGTRPVASSVFVTASALNVRSAPSLAAPVRATLYEGTQVSLTGATRFQDGFQWSQLTSGGWVASNFLSSSGGVGGDSGDVIVPVAGRAYVAASSGLLVRNAPAGRVVGSLGYGTPIALTGDRRFANGRTWVQLASGAWVAEEFVVYDRAQLG
jgi:peptidoglycan hydrolase-like protein with peptidoglycan-binding domain